MEIRKNAISDCFIDIGILTFLILVLDTIWSGLELLFYKEIQQRTVDTIIALITVIPYWIIIKGRLGKVEIEMSQKETKEICLECCQEQENCIKCKKTYGTLPTPCQFYGKKYKQSMWDMEDKR